MIVAAWNNGNHNLNGSGYGFKIRIKDRDTYFKQDWDTIILEFEGETQPVEININKVSFWNKTCRELVNLAIGQWLQKQGLAPWTKGHPPTFTLEPIIENRFKVIKFHK
jgi:hypothetical protein